MLSRRLVMRRTGVDNPDAEIERINSEEQSELKLQKKKLENMKLLVDAGGVLLEAAARAVGLDEEAIEAGLRAASVVAVPALATAAASTLVPEAVAPRKMKPDPEQAQYLTGPTKSLFRFHRT